MDDQIDVYVAAVQPKKPEWVSVLNLGTTPLELDGWTLEDKRSQQVVLQGLLLPGEAKAFGGEELGPLILGDKGGLVVLKDNLGNHVDRNAYSEKDVRAARGLPIFFPAIR